MPLHWYISAEHNKGYRFNDNGHQLIPVNMFIVLLSLLILGGEIITMKSSAETRGITFLLVTLQGEMKPLLIPDVPHQLVLNSAFINRTKINLRRSCNSLNFDAEYEKT